MSKYNLKELGVGRRMPDDPFFANGDTLCSTFVREGIVDIDDEQLCHQIVSTFPCEVPGCQVTFSSLLDFEMHYNSCHRFICSQCRKPLPSAHFLDLHLSETHDSFFAAQAARKPMFRCFVEECPVMSENVSLRRTHCIEAHSFPHDFRYDQSLKKVKKSNFKGSSNKLKSESQSMIVHEAQTRKPHTTKSFAFGHSKQVKSFSRNKPWHAQTTQVKSETELPKEITTSELMDTLPS